MKAKENLITLKPANLTFEQAAAVPVAAMTALQGLRDKVKLLKPSGILRKNMLKEKSSSQWNDKAGDSHPHK